MQTHMINAQNGEANGYLKGKPQSMMTTALKEIIRLWLRQKRKDLHWQDIFMTVYFGGLYAAVIVGIYVGFREELEAHPVPTALVLVVPLLAVSAQLGDLLMKLFWRRSPVEMDDYLRTRPVTPQDWSRFVLLDTSTSIMQWMLALMLAFAALFFLPWWAALLGLVLMFSVSLTNALFQNCWRRAPGNEWTLPLVFGYLVWTGVIWAVALAGLVLNVMRFGGLDWLETGDSVGDVSADVLLVPAALLVVNALACYVLQRYFTRMKNHNEEHHAPVAATAHSLGRVSLWSIEWVQLLRSKRLRVSFFAIMVVFLFNTYMQQSPTIQTDMHGVNIMLLFGMAFPSLILAQWVMGVEANFFSGIWTKPWSVEGILRRKYVFFCAICGAMALLLSPLVIWMGLSPLTWLCTLLFSCGVFILPFMATCLFSSRMDLFASSFFNYQGANKQLNFFSFIMFVPMGIYYAAYFLLPLLWAHVLIGGLGIVGLLLHRPYIHWIYTIWLRRRYKIMERWQGE